MDGALVVMILSDVGAHFLLSCDRHTPTSMLRKTRCCYVHSNAWKGTNDAWPSVFDKVCGKQMEEARADGGLTRIPPFFAVSVLDRPGTTEPIRT